MARWQGVIETLLAILERANRGQRGLRIEIDDAIWETEQIVMYRSESSRLGESSEDRRREFHAELRPQVVERLKNDPFNRIWEEALELLDNPWLRVPDHQRPR